MKMKQKVKDCWQKVKDWSGEHKEEIALGAIVAVVGAVGVAVHSILKNMKSHEDEGQDILEALERARELDGECDENFKDTDRYVIDTSLMNQLPPGKYDVFDSYENRRTEYVVEKAEESMET